MGVDLDNGIGFVEGLGQKSPLRGVLLHLIANRRRLIHNLIALVMFYYTS